MAIGIDEIAANVRAELSRHRVTQQQAAALLELQQPAVSARLAGRTPFRADELARLAELLGVPIGRFYVAEVAAS